MEKQLLLTRLLTFVFIIYLLCLFDSVRAHGRLWEPCGRSSMWKRGYSTPHNYQDNELYCGGFHVQYDINGGKCGVCGDPYNKQRDNEVTGKYATGIIVRNYTEGQQMEAQVQLTANHKGWFMFTICPKKKYSDPEPLECFESHPLKIVGIKDKYKFPIRGAWGSMLVKVNITLPKGLSCPYCVFRWKYNAGNSWGIDPITKVGCIGCGNQEQFYGCADITIFPDADSKSPASMFTWNKHNFLVFLTAAAAAAAIATDSIYSANI